MPARCSIGDCDSPHYSRGWCKKHYMRWFRHGDPVALPPRRPRKRQPRQLKPLVSCKISDCTEAANCRGWCRSHYNRWYRSGNPIAPEPITTLDRYWARVDKSGGPDACWLWTAGRNKLGYGVFCHGQSTSLAHRWGYEHRIGPIPDGHGVLHRCDNPPCQNDQHWFTGTVADNVADMVTKGRGRIFRGAEHYRSKLDPDVVREIRRRYAAGGVTQEELARRFDRSTAAVGRLLRRSTWQRID